MIKNCTYNKCLRHKSQKLRLKSQRLKSQKPKAKTQEPKAKSQKPKAKTQESKAKTQEPKVVKKVVHRRKRGGGESVEVNTDELYTAFSYKKLINAAKEHPAEFKLLQKPVLETVTYGVLIDELYKAEYYIISYVCILNNLDEEFEALNFEYGDKFYDLKMPERFGPLYLSVGVKPKPEKEVKIVNLALVLNNPNSRYKNKRILDNVTFNNLTDLLNSKNITIHEDKEYYDDNDVNPTYLPISGHRDVDTLGLSAKPNNAKTVKSTTYTLFDYKDALIKNATLNLLINDKKYTLEITSTYGRDREIKYKIILARET